MTAYLKKYIQCTPKSVLTIFTLISRLDQILGKQGSKAKDVYESKICLASRIVKVERQVRYRDNEMCLIDLNTTFWHVQKCLFFSYLFFRGDGSKVSFVST